MAASPLSLRDYVSEELTQTSGQDAYSCPVAALNEALPTIRQSMKDIGLPEDGFGLELRSWQGALARIAHQSGQFPVVTKGTLEEECDSFDQFGLISDLEVLRELSDLTKDILYSLKGSESDFAVVPVLLKNDGASGPLILKQYFQSLRLDPQLRDKFPDPRIFEKKDDFLGYIQHDHLKLEQPEHSSDADRQKLFEALKCLASHADPPFAEIIAGDESLYNPIPVFWLGKSPNTGCILGLLSAIVWT